MEGIGYIRRINGRLQLSNIDASFQLKNFNTKMDNLFPDNPVLGESQKNILMIVKDSSCLPFINLLLFCQAIFMVVAQY